MDQRERDVDHDLEKVIEGVQVAEPASVAPYGRASAEIPEGIEASSMIVHDSVYVISKGKIGESTDIDEEKSKQNIVRDAPTVLHGWQLRISVFG